MMYFTRGAEGLLGSSSSDPAFTAFEPMVGFVFVLGFPLAIASGLWSVLVVGLALVIGQTTMNPFRNPGAESLRFGFPVLVAFFLTLALLLRAFFPKNLVAARRDRNRASAAQQALSSMVDNEGPTLTRVSAAARCSSEHVNH